MTTATLASVHRRFEAALPVIRQSARYALRRRRHDRDDLLAEVIACAWKAWRGLVERGRNPTVVGVTGIAAWAARHALKGRRIGNRGGGRGAMDIFHRRARRSAPSAWTPTIPGRPPRPARGPRPGRNGSPPTAASAPPTRRASGSISKTGSRACPNGDGGRPSCSPRATGPSRLPGPSGSRRRP